MVAPLGEKPAPYLEAVLRELRHAENHLVAEAPELARKVREFRVRFRDRHWREIFGG
jgi:hypothetical protein